MRKLKTKIDKYITSKKRITLSVTSDQLWYMSLALNRVKSLIPRLKEGTEKLSKELFKIGVEKIGWFK